VEVNKLIWSDRRRYVDSTARKAQSAADLGNIKGVFNSIKCLSNASEVSTVSVKTKDGTTEGQLQRWWEFLKKSSTLTALLMRKRNTIEEGSYLHNKVNEEQENCRFG
jgi:hypothetical protein